MEQQQIELVQSSFAKVAPIAGEAAELFYNRLFELDPDLQALFKGDITEQGIKLMSMLKTAVAGLSNIDTLAPAVQELGIRHKGYGVEDSHYDTVGEALLWTLEQGLGDAWNEELKSAWTDTYVLLSGVMKSAAES